MLQLQLHSALAEAARKPQGAAAGITGRSRRADRDRRMSRYILFVANSLDKQMQNKKELIRLRRDASAKGGSGLRQYQSLANLLVKRRAQPQNPKNETETPNAGSGAHSNHPLPKLLSEPKYTESAP